MSEKRVRRRRGWLALAIILIVVMVFSGIILIKNNEKTEDDERGYVSNMSDKSDLELEEMALKDLIEDLTSRGFKYEETEDINSEQYGFNLVFNLMSKKEDYCKSEEYRKHDLTMAYCELKYPTVREDEEFVEE